MRDDTDDAIDTATQRTRQAQERLMRKPIESPEIVDHANVVQRRTEDLNQLAAQAVDEADAQED
jgi:hypothetical protein